MGRFYFASHISDNILVTPPVEREDGTKVPGRLICKDAVIARTGWQTYQIADLDPDEAAALGVDLSSPTASIDLYRPEEELFAPATIASFNTAPVTFNHPDEFVATDNWREVAFGHVQAVRRGSEPLESGDLPLVADLVINSEPLFSEVLSGRLRQISCGYQYRLARAGKKLLMSAIVGNHVAVVPKGRAGPAVKIYDAAPEVPTPADSQGDPNKIAEVAPPPRESVKPELRQYSQSKETVVKKNWIAILTGLGLKQLAADPATNPEDLTAAASALHSRAMDSEESEESKAEKKKAEDAKRAKDEAEEKERKDKDTKDAKEAKDVADKKAADEAEEKKKAEDAKRAKDAEPSHFAPCKVKDCMDRDCRMHGALDSILEAHPKENAEDAAMNELKQLLSEFMTEEASAAHDDEAGVIEPISESEMDAEPEGKGKGNDALAADRAAEFAILKAARKTIVDSGDKALIANFNTRLSKFTGSSRANLGSHAAFARGARTRDGQGLTGNDRDKKLTDHFRQFRGKISQEAK